ncbi:hypothetical protein C7999DRAFT_27791 [Corynascus novoguineensis]|uniref:Peptidase C45 hydrolase domain-containing protein n=1 Tax=Corynascus novoguineensis TaxID=1126955 RepID=A0AAN7D0E8_9PEZI|nr:hypothetical protein C7999DRAFT_27791 [Corynascus novoguineensis]
MRDKIKANVARHLGHPHLPPWNICLILIQRFYIPGLKKFWPSGLEELIGISHGSGVLLEHLVLLHARDDLAVGRDPVPGSIDESTTAFFSQRVTADYVPLLVYSWASAKYKHDESLIVCLEIRFSAEEDLPAIFMVTEAGLITGCGVNANGVAVAGNRLLSAEDCLPCRNPAFPVACLDRLVLERPDDKIDPFGLQEGLFDAIDRYASRHLLVASNKGHSFSIELGAELGYNYYGKLGSRAKVHTNHFQSLEAFARRRESWDAYEGRTSLARLARVTDLVENLHNGARLSAQQIIDVFSDHHCSPESVCQHREDGRRTMTMGLVMLDTNRLVISVCRGPPCRGVMWHFTFQKDSDEGSYEEGIEDEEMSGARTDESAPLEDVPELVEDTTMEEDATAQPNDEDVDMVVVVGSPGNIRPACRSALAPPPGPAPGLSVSFSRDKVGLGVLSAVAVAREPWLSNASSRMAALSPQARQGPAASASDRFQALCVSDESRSETTRSAKRKNSTSSPVGLSAERSKGESRSAEASLEAAAALTVGECGGPNKKVKFQSEG